jgi:hypothetical protein
LPSFDSSAKENYTSISFEVSWLSSSMVGAFAGGERTWPSAGELNLALSDERLELARGVTGGEKIHEASIEIISER